MKSGFGSALCAIEIYQSSLALRLVFCNDQCDRNGANNDRNDGARGILYLFPSPPSLLPASLAKSPCHGFRATSISDNSPCTHVRRIYADRKAELCLSNINTILESEMTMRLRILYPRAKTTMDLRANTDYRLYISDISFPATYKSPPPLSRFYTYTLTGIILFA